MSVPWSLSSLLVVMAIALVPRIIAVFVEPKVLPRRSSPKRRDLFAVDPSLPAHETLARYWAYGGDHPKPFPAVETAIHDLEQRYGIVLPADFRTYLLHVAPEEDHWDEGDATWWPLSRIHNIPEEYEHPLKNPVVAAMAGRCLFFADYMIWCWAWVICCEEGDFYGKVAVIGSDDRWVADSFTDFVRKYVADPLSVC